MKHINEQEGRVSNNPVTALRRRLARAAIVAMAAFSLLAAGTVAPQAALAAEGGLGEPAHTKTVTPNDDGTYTISLNVKGDSTESSSETHQPIDVVVVVDTSGSMSWSMSGSQDGSYERLIAAKAAVNSMAKTLLTSENESLPADQQVRMSVVSFATTASDASSFYSSSSDVASAVNSLGATGGTNWEDALAKANAASSGRENAKKYIVFLSDGDPTFRMSKMGNSTGEWRQNNQGQWVFVYGTGSSDQGNRNFNAAVQEANKRGEVQLFAVGLSSDPAKMSDFASQVGGKYFSATSTEELNKAFGTIAEQIKTTATYKDVSIADTLSQYFEYNGTFTADGPLSDATYSRSDQDSWNDAPKATVDADGKLNWDLSKIGKLEKGVTYTVSFKVTPKQNAFDEQAANTSKQFPTNDEASLTYTKVTTTNKNGVETETDDGPHTAKYNKPEVQVPTSTVTVTKVWSDGADAHKDGSVKVTLKQDGEVDYGSETLSAENQWTTTFTVPAGPDGHTYSVAEDAVDGYDTTITYGEDASAKSVTLQGLTAQAGTATVTNTLALVNFTITKQVNGNAANPDATYSFNIVGKDKGGNPLNGNYTITGLQSGNKTVTFTDGTATLDGVKVNSAVTIADLPKNASLTISETNLDKTVKTVTLKEGNNDEQTLDIKGDAAGPSKAITLPADTAVTVTNTSELVPVTGVFMNNTPMAGLLGISAAGLIAVAGSWFARRKFGEHGWKE